MRNLLFAATLALLAPVAAMAQDAPAVEVFGGYSYSRVEGANLNGWNVAVAGNVNDWFGIEGDVSGHYGTQSEVLAELIPPGTISRITFDDKISQHTFLVGPKLSARGDRLTGYVHALVGGVRRHEEFSLDVGPGIGSPPFPDDFALEGSQTGFAAAVGAGLDVKLTDRVSWRVVQADYLPQRFEGHTIGSARIATGLVITFGR